MARVIWTPEAFRQLDAIREYMLEAAPDFAGALLVGILAAMEPAGRFPRMGRMVPEFQRPDVREIIYDNYRIVYVIDGDKLSVVSVLHASMDVANRLREQGIDG